MITDSRSGVGALTQKDRIPGIVQGVAAATGKLEMVQIPIASTVEKGQIVVTAGLESLYLKGIPIGTITSVSREGSGLFNSATVTPFVDFGRLEEVLVILTGNDGQSEVNTAAMSPPWGTAENSGSEANAG